MRAFIIQPNLSIQELSTYFDDVIHRPPGLGWITKRETCRLKRVIDIAKIWADNSVCPKGKRHCCIVVYDSKYIIGMGYNGPPANMPACTECVYTTKNREANELNKCPAVHSEINAVLNMDSHRLPLRTAERKLTAIITKTPCKHCRAVLLNAGIEIIIVNEVTYDG